MKTFSLLVAMLCQALLLAQTLYTVDNNSPSAGDFSTITAAINAASAGDTLYIIPSTVSYGDITMNKVLHLRGGGHAPEVTNGAGSQLNNIVLNIPLGGSGITFSGIQFNYLTVSGSQVYQNLQITNSRFQRVTAGTTLNQCNNWVLIGNVISANIFDVINKQNSQGWIVTNNYIRQESASISWSIFRKFNSSDVVRNNIIVNQYNSDPGQIFNDCQGLLVENSIFVFNGNSTGFNFSDNTLTFNNCLSYSYPGQTLNALPGLNNLNNQNPQFVSIGANPYYTPNKDFSLLPSSPGAGAGTDGQDIGVYGSDFNFSSRGYAQDLPYITKMEVTNAVINQGGMLNVNFEAKAQ